MNKWDYIKLISRRGSRYGGDGGVLDLLNWCGKSNTCQVTQEEARLFFECYKPCRETGVLTAKKPQRRS